MKQILLNAKECSGRGVRVRTLSLDACNKVALDAASAIGKEGTMFELRARTDVDSVHAFVAEVTERAGFKSMSELVKAGADAGWKKLTLLELTDSASKYFSSKDMSALVNVFKSIHVVTEKEVDDILGEALEVTED